MHHSSTQEIVYICLHIWVYTYVCTCLHMILWCLHSRSPSPGIDPLLDILEVFALVTRAGVQSLQRGAGPRGSWWSQNASEIVWTNASTVWTDLEISTLLRTVNQSSNAMVSRNAQTDVYTNMHTHTCFSHLLKDLITLQVMPGGRLAECFLVKNLEQVTNQMDLQLLWESKKFLLLSWLPLQFLSVLSEAWRQSAPPISPSEPTCNTSEMNWNQWRLQCFGTDIKPEAAAGRFAPDGRFGNMQNTEYCSD